MVDDPSSLPELYPTAKKQEKERERLFKLFGKSPHFGALRAGSLPRTCRRA